VGVVVCGANIDVDGFHRHVAAAAPAATAAAPA
jgi:hypothetical protein